MTEGTARTTYFVRGMVQGVGFRWWTRAQALELGLAGHARNMSDGRVEVVAEGPADTVEELGQRLSPAAPPGAGRRRPGHVESCVAVPGEPRGDASGFVEK
ncbi:MULTISPECIES: acylphosphatase [Arsenicicoccus]|uniref:acylphosphatase n=1 Tax=Arsenicicoccus TaxID=267408 RepID=UPI00257F7F9E|nr:MULTISPECIES: acylphosphatase [Arsenicicoccus]